MIQQAIASQQQNVATGPVAAAGLGASGNKPSRKDKTRDSNKVWCHHCGVQGHYCNTSQAVLPYSHAHGHHQLLGGNLRTGCEQRDTGRSGGPSAKRAVRLHERGELVRELLRVKKLKTGVHLAPRPRITRFLTAWYTAAVAAICINPFDDERPTLPLHLPGGNETSALYDTGAIRSLLSEEAFRLIPVDKLPQKLPRPYLHLVGANDTPIQVRGL